MPVSFARTWLCASCGYAVAGAVEWLTIDFEERPDLRAPLANRDLLETHCNQCGRTIGRVTTLLAIGLHSSAPVVLGAPELLPTEAAIAESEAVIARARDALGDRLRDLPGPMLVAPLDVLALVASRTLDHDLSAPAEALQGLTSLVGDELAARYGVFLQDVSASAQQRRLFHGLNYLRTVVTKEDFEATMERFPELLADGATVALRGESGEGPPEYAQIVDAQTRALETAREGDIAAAWALYETAIQDLFTTHLQPRVGALLEEFDEHAKAGRWSEAAAAAEELLVLAGHGVSPLEVMASVRLASALYEQSGEARGERIERSVALLERTLEIMDDQPEFDDKDTRIQALVNLGAAYGARLHGDPLLNYESAIAYQEQALTLISEESPVGYSAAMAHTNLGLSLLERATEITGRGSDLRPPQEVIELAEESIAKAIDHFHRALEWRTYDRDPLDWAFTQINLGLAYTRSEAANRVANLEAAAGHFSEAARGFSASGNDVLHGQALHNLASAETDLAGLTNDDENRDRHLARAEEFAHHALRVRPLHLAPLDAGRTWYQLGDIYALQGQTEQAMTAYKQALVALTPETAPRSCRDAASRLAGIATRLGNWDLAASAGETAAMAAAAASDARATGAGRIYEVFANVNIYRWAGYALARAGRLERAVEILELGRAREVSRWLRTDIVDTEGLRQLSPHLCERFISLQARQDSIDRDERAGEALAPEAADVAQELRATIAEIRVLPGFESFLLALNFSEIAAVARDGEALCYLLTAPQGSMGLIVKGGEVAAVAADLSSTEVATLLVGDPGGPPTGYLHALSEDWSRLDRWLEELAAQIGEQLLKPIAENLSRESVSTVCLIPIGLLGLLPLHALDWEEGSTRRCLLDEFGMVFAPSALTRRVCVRRASTRGPELGRATVIGNPLPHSLPLDGAEYEAQVVARTVMARDVDLLVGVDATKAAALSFLPGSDWVHLACHGSAMGMETLLSAELSLAHEEPITAREILDLEDFSPRLVVASACETAVVQGYETADEALALSTLFLAAGSAGVVATLWAVDDYATAMLMSRFYEELRDSPGPVDPALALRTAQLWLRSLTEIEEEEYLASRPLLREQRRARSSRRGDREPVTPYAARSAWGAFMAAGA